jgi:uncharacterized protein YjbJ (UPF0337 family)
MTAWAATARGSPIGMGKKIGKAKEVIGYATGDREVEARGRVEEKVADPHARLDEDQTAEREQLDVRKEHGEYQADRIGADRTRPDRTKR